MTTIIEQIKKHFELEIMTTGDGKVLLEKVKQETIEDELSKLQKEVFACTKCGLDKTKSNYVFGEGNTNANLMFIGDTPGHGEDKAGKLLTKMICAIGYKKSDVYIANIFKCTKPEEKEMDSCISFLERQIEYIKPKVICTLGSLPTHRLLDSATPISKLRGSAYSYKGIPVVPTFHPSYLLKNEDLKKDAWEDLKLVKTYDC